MTMTLSLFSSMSIRCFIVMFTCLAATNSLSHMCTTQDSVAYTSEDTKIDIKSDCDSVSTCCNLCNKTSGCYFFTYNGETSSPVVGKPLDCVLHNENAPDSSKPLANTTSGYLGYTPPAPLPPPIVDVVVGGRISQTFDNFVCWNMDASRNRQFFDRNLSGAFGAQLAAQARAISDVQRGGSILRFGGTGNDYLTYEIEPEFPCPPRSETSECMNLTWWTNLLDFTEASGSKMIFGLSMNTGHDRRRLRSLEGEDAGVDGNRPPDPFPRIWDASNAHALLNWTIAHGRDHLLYGFELGNEQNTQYSGDEIAANFAVLSNLTRDLWPDETRRPLLFGPDPHSFHDADKSLLAFIREFLEGVRSRQVPLKGVTHHEYIEVDTTSFLSPDRLDITSEIASAVNATVRSVDSSVAILAGEVGPHNGGSPPCDNSYMRWR